MSDLGQFFDHYAGDWDVFYQGDQARAFDYRNRQRLLLELVAKVAPAGARVLELGCGAGHTALRLGAAGYRVTCVDISPKMIDATRENLARAKVAAELHVGTVHDLPAQAGDFDVIVAAGMMEYVTDRDATLRAVRTRLRPGGVAILSFTNSATPLYWLEVPFKRAVALGAYAVTRAHRWRDIAFPASRADALAGVRRQFEQAELAWQDAHYFTYGLRMGSTWWPPLAFVRRADKALAGSRLRSLGRTFFAVGRRVG
jgi:2-polyprenyl-3-methyl-5-hydroxy-6-metoxy-1,4-benzoquinol methylase